MKWTKNGVAPTLQVLKRTTGIPGGRDHPRL
jgi:hypothetical protein